MRCNHHGSYHANSAEAQHGYGVSLLGAVPKPGQYAGVMVALAFGEFKQMGINGFRRMGSQSTEVKVKYTL